MNEWMSRKKKYIYITCCASKMLYKICLDTETARAFRLPRQLVACAIDGQVGVESTGVCGPVRAEAGDWHTAHAG